MNKIFLSLLFMCSCYAVYSQAYPLVSIHDIQYKDNAALAADDDLSNYAGDTVRIQGIVTMNPCSYALSDLSSRMGTFMQDPDGGPWNGIHVLIDYNAIGYPSLLGLNDATLFVDNFQVGNIVECTGIVSTFDGNTQFILLPIASEIVGFSSMPSPHVSTIDTFMVSDGAGGQVLNTLDGEQYEGTYVEFDNVYVTDVVPSGSRWYWYLQDADGNKIQIRDMSGYFRNDAYDDECSIWGGGAVGDTYTPDYFAPPVIGTYLSYVRGVVLEFTVGTQYAIAPLLPEDVGPSLASPPVVSNILRTPIVATSTDNIDISATIIDIDGTVAAAQLNYSYGYGNTSFLSTAMSNIAADTWKGTIPATGVDSQYVNYYITAIDNDGNSIDYPAAVSPKTFIVYDGGITSIVQIQNTPYANGNSVWMNDSIPTGIDIQAIVTSTINTYDLGLTAIQESSSPYSAVILVGKPGYSVDGLHRGDKIHITGAKVIENFGQTRLEYVTYTLISAANPLPAFIESLSPLDIDAKIYSSTEPYESMLVKFNNQYVTSNNADAATGGEFGEWRINTSNTPEIGMRCNDFSYAIDDLTFGEDTLSLGENLGYIQGILDYSFSNWKLEPRDKNDIEGYHTTYPNNIVSFNFSALVPAVNGSINEAAHSITLNVPVGTDITSLVPTITYTGQNISPGTGVPNDFTFPQTYTCYSPVNATPNAYTVTVNVVDAIQNLPGLDLINVYPNPVNGIASVAITADEATSLTFELKDIAGRNILIYNDLCASGKNIFTLDMRTVANGLYLLQISSPLGSTILKIEVSK